MSNFFRNIKINFEEFLEKIKFTDKKVIVKTAICIIVAIFLAISISLIVKESKDPAYNVDKTADNYISAYTKFDYYNAYNFTILGKNGVDEYIINNYLKDLKEGEISSKDSKAASNSFALAYSKAFFNKVSMIGYNDCDQVFDWYFKNVKDDTTKIEKLNEFATQQIMLDSFKKVIEAYKVQTDDKLKEEYIGYDLRYEETNVTEFIENEVNLYIENKSDKSKKTFENANINPNKIKAVKKYEYNILINSNPSSTISIYLVKIGQKWYVDNTALI